MHNASAFFTSFESFIDVFLPFTAALSVVYVYHGCKAVH